MATDLFCDVVQVEVALLVAEQQVGTPVVELLQRERGLRLCGCLLSAFPCSSLHSPCPMQIECLPQLL